MNQILQIINYSYQKFIKREEWIVNTGVFRNLPNICD